MYTLTYHKTLYVHINITTVSVLLTGITLHYTTNSKIDSFETIIIINRT